MGTVSELSLLVSENLAVDAGMQTTSGMRQVGRALEVYSKQMADNPSLHMIATEVGVSIAHFRRLFHTRK